jgi:hypothetical protein
VNLAMTIVWKKDWKFKLVPKGCSCVTYNIITHGLLSKRGVGTNTVYRADNLVLIIARCTSLAWAGLGIEVLLRVIAFIVHGTDWALEAADYLDSPL